MDLLPESLKYGFDSAGAAAFEEHDITIPFSPHDLHIKAFPRIEGGWTED